MLLWDLMLGGVGGRGGDGASTAVGGGAGASRVGRGGDAPDEAGMMGTSSALGIGFRLERDDDVVR